MRLGKKLGTAVTAVAVCCAMVIPMTTNAATCSTHYFTKIVDTNVITEGGYYEHNYDYGYQEIDGVMQPIVRTCYVNRLVYYYTMGCTFCPEISSEETVKYKEDHRQCGLGIVDLN